MRHEMRMLLVILFFLGSLATSRVNAAHETERVLIILAHPNMESFNHSVSATVEKRLRQRGFEVSVRDLYQLGFDPLMTIEELKTYESVSATKSPDVQAEQQAILNADHVVFIYPTWWWSPPAILKGYLDRVFTPGFAFANELSGEQGKLAGKTVSVIQTTGADENFIKTEGMDEAVKKLFSVGIFGFCGMEVAHHEFLMGIAGKSYDELKQVLQEVDMMVDAWF